MVKEYSPFTPGVPVPIEFFVGRSHEIQTMMSAIRKSVGQNTIERLFVTGERGVGKSSICRFVDLAAEKDLGVLAIHVFLGGVNTLEEMVHRVFERLVRESATQPWFGRIKDFLGNHIKRMDIFG
ncbi:MAG TPA: ATP-binding protein [Phycisphaerae bacterium]|nr:ATP-binding protein [Phycisphaerae bacterium]HOQ87021.1 ATP-binding protein [Phycisphaerae bacterium]HPP25863.1 ATP-binding protein [Phycisphaerae bacterium]HQE29909.1 ATP-binding protein [Phycisphaerae bacterium]